MKSKTIVLICASVVVLSSLLAFSSASKTVIKPVAQKESVSVNSGGFALKD